LELRDPGSFVEFGDFEEIVASVNFGQETVSGIKAGRLVYHYKGERRRQILRNIAKILTVPGTLVFLIHHCPEFNKGYDYKTSIPCPTSEILAAFRETAGPNVKLLNEQTLVKDTLRYFDYQNLTWLAFGQ